MKIAAVQMCSSPVPADNLARAAALVAEAAAQGAELVALPEYFGLMGRRDADKLVHTEMPGQGPMQDALARLARQHGLWLVGGTLPLKLSDDDRHVTNSCLVWGPDGQVAARYDKIHLFRFDDGERRYDEAATLDAGAQAVCFDLPSRDGHRWRVGLSICYDLRFPELYRALAPADLMLVPSAFTWTTGNAHWEVLLRARAIENQCYLLAPAQGGQHENGRRTWGHSMLVDPWGEVVAMRVDDGEGVVVGEVARARLRQVRSGLPALSHRVM